MRSSSRKKFLAASAAAYASIGFVRFPAGAAEFTYKYGFDNPITHPVGQAASWWADKVKEESGGRMEIKVFPSEQLGTDPEMLSQVRSGALEFHADAGLIISQLVPVASIDSVAFAFPTTAVLYKAIDGDLGAHIRGEVWKAGLYLFKRQMTGGFREMTNSVRPINTPADLKGLKLRVPPAKLMVSMMSTLGGEPVGLSIAEVYSALQTHVIDGQENPLVTLENNKFYEVQKYCSMTNHVYAGWWLIANPGAWARLPAKLQQIVEKNYDLAVDRERTAFTEMNDSLQPKLMSQGVTFNKPAIGPFRDKLRAGGYYAQWKEAFGPTAWTILEKYAGKLA